MTRHLASILTLIFAAFWLPLTATAGEEPVPRILVTGEGMARLAPDMATLTLTVTREAETARAALDASSAAMQEVLAAMQAEGIEERDLQTADFAIHPKYLHPPKKASGEREPPRIVGYTVRNSLTVRVRDLEKVGRILDRSVTLGVNEGGSISFGNDDPAPALQEARAAAVKDALARARTIAAAAGVETGRILEITEQSFMPRPMNMAHAEMAMARAADAVPVATGENTYRVTVSLSVEIEE
jgi:uncharacterized protein YggE